MQSLGIDLGAVALFVWLVRRDLAARDKQMTRLLREEKLGILQIELANRKTLKLSQLRSFSRVVRPSSQPASGEWERILLRSHGYRANAMPPSVLRAICVIPSCQRSVI